MLHGMLLDKYGEFFIQKKEKRAQQDGGSQTEEGDEMTGLTGKQFTQALVRDAEILFYYNKCKSNGSIYKALN